MWFWQLKVIWRMNKRKREREELKDWKKLKFSEEKTGLPALSSMLNWWWWWWLMVHWWRCIFSSSSWSSWPQVSSSKFFSVRFWIQETARTCSKLWQLLCRKFKTWNACKIIVKLMFQKLHIRSTCQWLLGSDVNENILSESNNKSICLESVYQVYHKVCCKIFCPQKKKSRMLCWKEADRFAEIWSEWRT